MVDTVVQAYKVAEHKDVLLPVMVCYEGFVISHFLEPVELPDQELVDGFLPPYEPDHVVLDPDNVMRIQVLTTDLYFTEYKYQLQEAMDNAKAVIKAVDSEFGEKFGRTYGGLVQPYRMEDAEIAVLSMGSIAGLSTKAADSLRREGHKVGSLKLRVFRPFPAEDLLEQLKKREGRRRPGPGCLYGHGRHRSRGGRGLSLQPACETGDGQLHLGPGRQGSNTKDDRRPGQGNHGKGKTGDHRRTRPMGGSEGVGMNRKEAMAHLAKEDFYKGGHPLCPGCTGGNILEIGNESDGEGFDCLRRVDLREPPHRPAAECVLSAEHFCGYGDARPFDHRGKCRYCGH